MVAQYVRLPVTKRFPAKGLQVAVVPLVPGDIGLDLVEQVAGAHASRYALIAFSPVSPVPEVAVAKDHDSLSDEDDVRSTRLASFVESITEPKACEGFAKCDLGA